MTSMNPILRNKLLRHWPNYQPKLLAELQREGRLEEALETKVEQSADLMYELEIVLDQYFLPEDADESYPTYQNQPDNPPETSE